jgi:hypothetical protein
MGCSGEDSCLLEASAREPVSLDPSGYLRSWQSHRDSTLAALRFDERYQRVMREVPLRPCDTTGFVALSRAGLEVFHATHEFFALHLVTGSHAFRVCAPWAGPRPERLLGVALAAAYVAIGAPDFGPIDAGRAELPRVALASATDDHDIKLAYSCSAQARAHADADYEWVAARYLAPRLRRAAPTGPTSR